MIAFSDLGFGTAISNMFVLRYTSGEKKRAAKIAKTGFWGITTLIIVGLILSILVLFVFYEYNFSEELIVKEKEAFNAVFLMMASRLLIFYTQLYDGYFRSARKAFLSIHISNIYKLFCVVSGIIVLKFGGFMSVYALTTFLITIFYVPTHALIAKKTLPLEKIHKEKIEKNDLITSFKTGIGFLLFPLWQSIYFQGTTFIVRIILGPSSVAIFNTVRTLSRSINQLYSVINASIFPELQYEIGKGNFDKAKKLYRISLLVTFITAMIGMLFLYYFGLWFYQIWTSNELNPPEMMWYLFIVGVGFNALWWTAGVIFRAINRPYSFSLAGVIAAIISVFCTYFFTKSWGLIGAAFGAIMLDIILAVYILPVSSKLLNIRIKSLVSDSIRDLSFEIKKLKNKNII